MKPVSGGPEYCAKEDGHQNTFEEMSLGIRETTVKQP